MEIRRVGMVTQFLRYGTEGLLRRLLLGLSVTVLLAGCGAPSSSSSSSSASSGPAIASACPAPPAYAAPSDTLAADAGPDLEKRTSDVVILNGTASFDMERQPLAYHWHQILGPCVTLQDAESAQPSFIVPAVSAEDNLLKFRLVVESGGRFSMPDEAEILVLA